MDLEHRLEQRHRSLVLCFLHYEQELHLILCDKSTRIKIDFQGPDNCQASYLFLYQHLLDLNIVPLTHLHGYVMFIPIITISADRKYHPELVVFIYPDPWNAVTILSVISPNSQMYNASIFRYMSCYKEVKPNIEVFKK